MKSKFNYIDFEINKLKKTFLYRQLVAGKVCGPYITLKDKKLINLSSNDYLGISPTQIKKTQFQSSSRLVSGNDEKYKILEKKLSKHKMKEKSLIFPTGYIANIGTIGVIARKNDLILSDQLNHASIVEACKISGATIKVYKHNNIEDLINKSKGKFNRKIIVTEGIFSMDGDLAKLKEISEITQKNNIILILDDAHGDFVLGKDGRGTANHIGVLKEIDIYISSLSKALGSFGGYISSEKRVIDFCVNKSKPFIYTSALPNALIDHAIVRFETNREKQRRKLIANIELFKKGLAKIGITNKIESPIIPLMIGSEKKAIKFADFLKNHMIFARAIRYPTVEKNKARIRLSITAWLNQSHINYCLEILEKGVKKFDL